jgi:hypothetical protein
MLATPAYADEATPKKSFGQKAAHFTKKALMLPVYVLGGAGAGVIVWYHYGGDESKLIKLYKGVK